MLQVDGVKIRKSAFAYAEKRQHAIAHCGKVSDDIKGAVSSGSNLTLNLLLTELNNQGADALVNRLPRVENCLAQELSDVHDCACLSYQSMPLHGFRLQIGRLLFYARPSRPGRCSCHAGATLPSHPTGLPQVNEGNLTGWRATSSINHCIFVLEHHFRFPLSFVGGCNVPRSCHVLAPGKICVAVDEGQLSMRS